ncbi:MAG: response regulator [Treponema sp.]|jgi:signal transduction histidine kinase/CheY-like chemotaxis protein|nr:response regulator [Treponema sp.]
MQTADQASRRLGFPIVFAFFCPMLLVLACVAEPQSGPFYVDLRDSRWFVREGFDPNALPDRADDDAPVEWQAFTPKTMKRPLEMKLIGLPHTPKRVFLSPLHEPEREFMFVVPFSVNADMIAALMGETAAAPGLFLASIGDNWEVLLNGNVVRAETHLDSAGRIASHRSYRGVAFPLPRDGFREGVNYLTFRIIGSPNYEFTGFFYNNAYYIDAYERIAMRHNENMTIAMCAVYVFIGMYQMLVFLLFRKDEERCNLYYSLFSILSGLYCIMRSSWIHHYIVDSAVVFHIEFSLIFTIIPMLACFLESLSYQRISGVTKGYLLLNALMAVAQAGFSPQFAQDVLHVWYFVALSEVGYILFYDVLKAFRQKLAKHKTVGTVLRKTALGNLLFGLFFLLAMGLVDMIDAMFMGKNLLVSRYGLFIFTIVMFFILAKRYRTLYKTLDRVAAALADTARERTEQTRIAQESSESKTRFIAILTHEIRTPLNVINGLAEIELHKALPSETLSHFEKIRDSATALARLVNDTLDVSCIETGKFELTPVDYDLARLISDIAQLYIVQPESKPVSFNLAVNEDLPRRLYGDDLRLKQILNNLLSNAFKYTRAGVVSLALSGKTRGIDEITLHIVVNDTGIGIKPEDSAELFSEFSRFDPSENRLIEGTGLGLSITKKLTNLMGGAISVQSEYGEGTCFALDIPQRLVDDRNIGPSLARELETFRFADQPQRRKRSRQLFPNGKVLIVDDIAVNQEVLKGMMAPYRLFVDCVSSGEEAVTRLREANPRYDLVFMDMMMPGMDGMEAVRLIREAIDGDYARTVPIIACTADAQARDGKRYLDAGFDGFLLKPLDATRLDETLSTWLNQEPVAKPAPSALFTGLSLEGVDLAAGVTLYESEAIYLEVLRSYARHTPDVLAELRRLGENSASLAEYAVKVHGLKGATASIGASEAAQVAAAQETAAKSGDFAAVEAGLAPLLTLFTALLERLGVFLDHFAPSAPKQRLSEPDRGALTRLLAASKGFDIASMEAALSELTPYDYDSGADLVTWLQSQVSALEYAAITARLEAFL